MYLSWAKVANILPSLGLAVSGLVLPEDSHALNRRAMPIWDGFDNYGEHKDRIIQAFRDMKVMVQTVLDSENSDCYSHIFDAVINTYFAEGDQPGAKQILSNMIQPATKFPTDMGSDLIEFIQFNANDALNRCMPRPGSSDIPWGYTIPYLKSHPHPQIHFCHSRRRNAFAYPDLSAIGCEDFTNGRVSWRMLPLAYVLIHELTHTVEISSDVLGGEETTVDEAYGPIDVRKLRDQHRNGMGPLQTADSYAWFVTEAYWSIQCAHTYGPPETNQNFWPEVCKDGLGAQIACFFS
ncbi:hypothetical protein BJY00DRAFT_306353 [Aspergillus carlsbadensis]|nr:hypothetical protein BJY00DRAFT_306353 [Aspergillus carlsbadensis]